MSLAELGQRAAVRRRTSLPSAVTTRFHRAPWMRSTIVVVGRHEDGAVVAAGFAEQADDGRPDREPVAVRAAARGGAAAARRVRGGIRRGAQGPGLCGGQPVDRSEHLPQHDLQPGVRQSGARFDSGAAGAVPRRRLRRPWQTPPGSAGEGVLVAGFGVQRPAVEDEHAEEEDPAEDDQPGHDDDGRARLDR